MISLMPRVLEIQNITYSWDEGYYASLGTTLFGRLVTTGSLPSLAEFEPLRKITGPGIQGILVSTLIGMIGYAVGVRNFQSIPTNNSGWTLPPLSYLFAGRALTAVFAAMSVFLIFLIVKRTADTLSGVIAAILFSFHPYYLLLSTWIMLDAYMIFFCLVAIFSLLRFDSTGSTKWLAASAVFWGLSFSSKICGTSIALFLACTAWYLTLGKGDHRLKNVLVYLLTAAAIFLITYPYIWFHPFEVTASNLQWGSSRISLSYLFLHLSPWSEFGVMGGHNYPELVLMGIAGLVVGYRVVRNRISRIGWLFVTIFVFSVATFFFFEWSRTWARMNISDSLVVCVCLAPASGTATHYWPKVTHSMLPGFMLGLSVLSAVESLDTFLEHGWYASALSSGIVFGIQGSTLLMSVTYSFFLFSFLMLGGAFCLVALPRSLRSIARRRSGALILSDGT